MVAVEFPTLVREHRDDCSHRLLPAVALVADPDVERVQFRRPGPLAHAEVDAAARQQIECRHALRHPMRLVGGELDDAVPQPDVLRPLARRRSEEHTSELQSLMRISYAVFCLKKKTQNTTNTTYYTTTTQLHLTP